jgi:hypothetical protein
MGFTVETAAGRSIAIKAGKHNRTPVFVNLEQLAAAKGRERIKFLKEEAERGQLSVNVAKAVESASSAAELAAALDQIVDERGSPKKHEAAAGTPILQPTDERRRTGSHYTPRSLTEPIVRHALEPAFERLGPDATPEQILDLKVCDPAMGSGAFLVEACRALAARLVEAWRIHKDKKPKIPPDEDEDLHARRLVAQRCLYGVDKNPLATDLAKLSLWLATLARDHEFTFLDHALKSGDSLVGLTRAQIAAAHWDTSKPGLPLFRQLVQQRVAEAMKGRAEIQAAPDDTARAVQEQRHRSLEERIRDIRLIGDGVIAAFFAEERPKEREKLRAQVESWLTGSLGADLDKVADFALSLKKGAHSLAPFHWEIEFPEVFARQNGGFDAIVGNPPFAGKNTIISSNLSSYLPWLQNLHRHAHGNADLVAHFFRRAFALIRKSGVFGLVATNTIGQGDTRATGLAPILQGGGAIRRATRRIKWPGEAAVVVSLVHVVNGRATAPILDQRVARRISAYLVDGELDQSPAALAANEGKAFIGSYLLGMGFTFDDLAAEKGLASPLSEMHSLIKRRPRNAERIFPYIGGDEINTDPQQRHHRFAIDLGDMSETEARSQWPDLMSIIERLVRPQRHRDKRETYRRNWWRYAERRAALYPTVASLHYVLALSRVSQHLSIARLPVPMVYAERCVVFPFENFAPFSCIQSRLHEIWARSFSATMEDRLLYAPSDCFRSFALPISFEQSPSLEHSGHQYYDHRAAFMIARNEGMTKTYNRFHDPHETAEDICRLRELHAAMDRAVLEAYGWQDLAERAEPIFLDETNDDDHPYQGRLFWPAAFRDEVLARLLALNAERHAEEVRLGIAPGMNRKTRDDDDEVEDS